MLEGMVRLSLALFLTRLIWFVNILLHIGWLRTILWRRYSIVGMITVLMIYWACVSVILLVLAMFMSCVDSAMISCVCLDCLLFSVNQHPRNLKGWWEGCKDNGWLLYGIGI